MSGSGNGTTPHNAGPCSGPGPVPIGGRDRPSNDSNEMDAPMFRPEASNSTIPRVDPSGEEGMIYQDLTENEEDAGPTETSPLIRRSSGGSTTSAVPDTTPVFLEDTSPGRFWVIFSQILAALFIACFDGTIMASSHPVITSYFKSANAASWLSTAFLLTSTAFLPLLGRLSDAVGRKPLFLITLVIFTFATAWCALAQSIGSFIAARAVCGLGAGGSMAVAGILISDMVPIERRGVYQSYINVVFGIGSSLGAALGGAMAEALGWRWEFGVQIPPLLLCVAVSAVAIPGDIGLDGPRKGVWETLSEFDFKGSLLLTLSTTFAILGLSLGGNILPWSHHLVIASLSIAAVSFPTFIWVETRVVKPIMPIRLIRHSPHANLIFSNFIAAFLSNSILFNMPLYFQAVLLSSATSSGLRLVLPSVVTSAAGAMTGFAITWTRRLKWPLVSGALWYLAGCIALSFLRRGMPGIAYLLVLVPFSLGQGFQFPGTFMAVLAASTQAEQAVVTSTLLLWRSVGTVLGVAMSSLVVQNALVYYLGAFVHGENKAEIIERVRESIEAIAKLEEPYKEQVVQSYEASLRLMFILSVLVAAISVLLILPIKLPNLAHTKRKP